MDIAALKVSHSIGVNKNTTAAMPIPRSGVVMDIAAFKVRHSENQDATTKTC